MDIIRKAGFAYFFILLLVVAIGYVPGFEDADGRLFGLFTLDLYDDALHFASGLWGGVAAWMSRNAAVQYFRIFGVLYFADAVMGLLFGSGYLDGGIFIYGVLDLPLMTRFFANLPHILLGGGAILIGFVLAKRTA